MNNVFKANPKVNKLFVVNGVPFLKESEALNYAKGDKEKVEEVTREEAMKKSKSATKPDPKKDELKTLKAKAKELKIPGYGKMDLAALKEAIQKAEADGSK